MLIVIWTLSTACILYISLYHIRILDNVVVEFEVSGKSYSKLCTCRCHNTCASSFGTNSLNHSTNTEIFTLPVIWVMGQNLLLSILMGWTSINPSYFDVNYRGTIGFDTLPYEWCPKNVCWVNLSLPTVFHRIEHLNAPCAQGQVELDLSGAVVNSKELGVEHGWTNEKTGEYGYLYNLT